MKSKISIVLFLMSFLLGCISQKEVTSHETPISGSNETPQLIFCYLRFFTQEDSTHVSIDSSNIVNGVLKDFPDAHGEKLMMYSILNMKGNVIRYWKDTHPLFYSLEAPDEGGKFSRVEIKKKEAIHAIRIPILKDMEWLKIVEMTNGKQVELLRVNKSNLK